MVGGGRKREGATIQEEEGTDREREREKVDKSSLGPG